MIGNQGRRPLRILIVSEHYPPASGGVATSARRISRALAETGCDVQVFTFDFSRELESADYTISQTDGSVSITRFGPFFLKHPQGNTLSQKQRAILRRRAFNQMLSQAKQQRPDIVFSLYLLNAGFLGQLLANALQVPAVAGVRGNDIGLNIFHVERFAVIHWVLESAACIVAVNRHLEERMVMAFPSLMNKSSVVPNSVPDLLVPSLTATACPFDSRPALTLAFVGTPREKKGIAWLCQVLVHPEVDPRVCLLVVGPSLGTLERRLCGADWDRLVCAGRLHVTGQLPRENVPSWILAADAVVMPSIDDGMANAVLEGMILERCPIVTPVFGDLVRHGETGFVVPYGDTTALACVVNGLVGDRANAAQLGRAARASLASSHQPEDEALCYRAVFDRALRFRGGR